MVSFRNLYSFVSQIIPYQDSEHEKLYTHVRFLLTKLPRTTDTRRAHVNDEVEIKYYRLQKISEGAINLKVGEPNPLYGPTKVDIGQADEVVPLSTLVDKLNERFERSLRSPISYFLIKFVKLPLPMSSYAKP